MRDHRDEALVIAQSLKNLRFMIELQLHGSAASEPGSNADRAAAELRRMLDLEESLRLWQPSPAPVRAPLAAA